MQPANFRMPQNIKQSTDDVLYVFKEVNKKATTDGRVYVMINEKRGLVTFTENKTMASNISDVKKYTNAKINELKSSGNFKAAKELNEHLIQIEKQGLYHKEKWGDWIDRRSAVKESKKTGKELNEMRVPTPESAEHSISGTSSDSAAVISEPTPISKITPIDILTVKTIDEKINLLKQFSLDIIKQSHDTLNYTNFEQLKNNKKLAKVLMKSDLTIEQRGSLDKIVKEYYTIAEAHTVLKELRAFSRTLKQTEDTEEGHDVIHVFKKMLKSEGLNENEINNFIYNEDTIKDINALRKRYFEAAQPTQKFLKSGLNPTFVTGSTSASLVGIIQVMGSALSDQPALVPTGLLLKHSFVPLTGELDMGISPRGINQDFLSGMAFSGMETAMSYATRKAFIFDPKKEIDIIMRINLNTNERDMGKLDRLNIALLRLAYMDCNYDKAKIKEHIRTNVLTPLANRKKLDQQANNLSIDTHWKQRASLLGKSLDEDRIDIIDKCKDTPDYDAPFQRGQLVRVKTSSGKDTFGIIIGLDPHNIVIDQGQILRHEDRGFSQNSSYSEIEALPESFIEEEVRHFAPANEGKLNGIQKAIVKEEIERRTPEEKIAQALNQEPLNLNVESKKLITDSFPLIWASCSLSPQPFHGGVSREGVVEGKAELGKDIQMVFTDQEHVETLTNAVKEYGVTVYSFSSAQYMLRHHLGKKQFERT